MSTDPWAMVQRAEKGAETDSEIHAAVGAALSAWEEAEEGLAELFALFIGAPEAGPASGHNPAIRAYGTVISSSSRQQMIRGAADGFFYKAEQNDPVRGQFGLLMNEAAGYSQRRNDIAHGRAQLVPEKGFYLFPGIYSSGKNPVDRPAKYAYNGIQIHTYREGFLRLAQKLIEYAVFVGGSGARST